MTGYFHSKHTLTWNNLHSALAAQLNLTELIKVKRCDKKGRKYDRVLGTTSNFSHKYLNQYSVI